MKTNKSLTFKLKFKLNDRKVEINTSPVKRVLDLLREDFDLISLKEGCGEGECGACTVLMNGKPVTSCMLRAGQIENTEILTLEGIRETALGKMIIDAYHRNNAVQCGFCFPGFLMTTYSYILSGGDKNEDNIKRALAGNICRCTGYDKIIKSVIDAVETYYMK